jgi:hypothetical protein
LREFKEHTGEAVSKAYKARNVERLVDLLVLEETRYAGEPDR